MRESSLPSPDILIVDDSEAIRSTLSQMVGAPHRSIEQLDSTGMSVETVAQKVMVSTARVISLDGNYRDGTAVNILSKVEPNQKKFIVLTGDNAVAEQVKTFYPQVTVIVKCTPGDLKNYRETVRRYTPEA